MKKILVFCLLAALSLPCFAGNINVSGRAGVYTIPGGGGTSAMYGLSADYGITPNLSVRGALETTSYTANSETVTYTPVTLDLIYHQAIGMLEPYAGAGVSYNSTNAGGVTTQTAGAQAEAGIKFSLGSFSAGIEYRYLVPDLNHTASGTPTYNAYATSSFSQSFSF
jgi:hypothetical protein